MSLVNYQLHEGLAILSLSHSGPPVIGVELMSHLGDAVATSRADGARAVLLRTEGPVFLAGADAADFDGVDADVAREMFSSYIDVIHAIESLDVPTVAAVRGLCLGGGLELALACDLVIAQKGTMLGQVEARIGGMTFMGGAHRLAERCGPSRALEITYTGALYTADDFATWGIVSKVIDQDNFEAKAMSLANSLAQGPTAAYRTTKQVLRRARNDGRAQADALLLELGPGLVESTDMRAAVAAMLTMGSREFMAAEAPVTFVGE